MKKNKLYTVSKFNMPAFLPQNSKFDNQYSFGGGFKEALGDIKFGGMTGLGKAIGEGIGRMFGVKPENDYGFDSKSYVGEPSSNTDYLNDNDNIGSDDVAVAAYGGPLSA